MPAIFLEGSLHASDVLDPAVLLHSKAKVSWHEYIASRVSLARSTTRGSTGKLIPIAAAIPDCVASMGLEVLQCCAAGRLRVDRAPQS